MIVLVFLAVLGYWAVIVLVVALCAAAAQGDRMARRALGPASSDRDFEVLVGLGARVPAEDRRDGLG